jgi:hypothetical protein
MRLKQRRQHPMRTRPNRGTLTEQSTESRHTSPARPKPSPAPGTNRFSLKDAHSDPSIYMAGGRSECHHGQRIKPLVPGIMRTSRCPITLSVLPRPGAPEVPLEGTHIASSSAPSEPSSTALIAPRTLPISPDTRRTNSTWRNVRGPHITGEVWRLEVTQGRRIITVG